MGRHSEKVAGELHVTDGRVSGKASQPGTEGMFPTAFDVRFDVELLEAGESLPATVVKKPGPAANVPPTVTGMFKGNGKEAKIAYVSAHWGSRSAISRASSSCSPKRIIRKSRSRTLMLAFGKFGSALIISLHEDGKSSAARWSTARIRSRASARSARSGRTISNTQTARWREN